MSFSHYDTDAFVELVNDGGWNYHTIELPDGRVLRGDYDMRRYVEHYGFPADLRGKTVLDVGTSSGWFAFELERRGADVTAVDVWDGEFFAKVAEIVGSRARYVQTSIYDLDEAFGTFDLVFCGSLLLHLSDLFEAVRRIRSVCRGQAIVATAISPDRVGEDVPLCEFIGTKATDGDYWTYWLPNVAALKAMLLAAGFASAEEVSRFYLTAEPDRKEHSTFHGVVKAAV